MHSEKPLTGIQHCSRGSELNLSMQKPYEPVSRRKTRIRCWASALKMIRFTELTRNRSAETRSGERPACSLIVLPFSQDVAASRDHAAACSPPFVRGHR